MKDFKISKILENSLKDEQFNLKDLFELKIHELNMTDHQAYQLLGMDKKSLNPILEGTAKQPNLYSVMKVADFLGLPLEGVITTLLSKQKADEFGKFQKVNETSFITKYFDIEKLRKVKFIASKNDTDLIKDRILSFFGFDSILDYEKYDSSLDSVLYSRTKRTFVDKMRDFSIKAAHRMFELIDNPNDYDREELKDLITKIKPYSQDVEDGLLIVCKALYNIGVTVHIQQSLTTTQFRGATFIIKGKPCIVLTDLNQNYATLWFALLHELYHVLFDFEQINKQTYHLTGQPDLFLVNETLANEFAQEYFFDENMYRYIKPYIHNEYFVNTFAKKNQIHSSFVYRGFQHYAESVDNQNYWAAFKDKFPKIDNAIKGLFPLVWKKDEIPSKAEVIKNIFELKS